MKYFTLLSLTFLAISASASTTATATTSSSNEENPSSFANIFSEALYSIQNLFTARKNLIKAHLELPKPLKADKFVSITPTENICIFPNKSEFWKSLYDQTDPVFIEKIIFCPEAIGYLADIKAAKLAASKSVEELRPIISALLLRRETLINKYSQAYVDNQFLACYNTLWAKLHNTSTTPYWPCNGSPCTPAEVKANFSAFTKSTPPCQDILSDQLAAYADKVAEITGTTKDPVTSAVDLRAAILENLNSSPHLSLALTAFYDTVSENNKIAAAEKIQAELADLKGIIEKQSVSGMAAYRNAVQYFEARLANRPVANIEAVVKNESTVNSDSASTSSTPYTSTSASATDNSIGAASSADAKTDISAAAADAATPPTKTENEPTKTTQSIN